MSLTGQTKTASSSLVASTKSSATLYGMKKSGSGWDYNQPDIVYDDTTDAEGRVITYDGVGSVTTLVGLAKTAA